MLKTCLAVAALAMVSGTALAAPVTITATGEVLGIDSDDGVFGTPFTGPVTVGTPVSVSVTFDLALFGADTASDPTIGVYGGGGISSRVQVGNDVFEFGPPVMLFGVLAGAAAPTLTTYSFGLVSSAGLPYFANFALNFEVETGTPTDAVPVGPLNPADFQNLRLQYQIQQGVASDPNVKFDRFVASVAPVPLPAGVWLLLGGVGALASLRNRRRYS